MKEKILEICKNLCSKEITSDEQLIISGLLDSFKIMELISNLEEEFGITFLPDEIMELENFYCVNSILKIVESKEKSNA